MKILFRSVFAALALVICLSVGLTVPARAADGQLIIIDTQANTLTLYEDRQLVKTYRIASGKRSSLSPAGIFKIISKDRNWGSGFGSRFMRINVPWGIYAIHGTNKPGLIGKDVSKGCIRMRNTDVEDLYSRVKVGTPVLIEASPYGDLDDALYRLSPGNRGAAVLEVQKRLKNLGYYTGTLDGIYGEQTKKALLAFKLDQGLPYDHYVDAATYRRLGIVLFE